MSEAAISGGSSSWLRGWIRWLQDLVAMPPLLALILVIDVIAYFGGLLYWYGYVMAQPDTPMWAWPFIPDCPLFGMLGGLGLLMVTARRYWSEAAQARGQRWLAWIAVASVAVWLSTYLPGVPMGWASQAAMLGVWSWAMVMGAIFFRRAPAWLLGLFAFGQIKYGIWTVTAWLLFWKNTVGIDVGPELMFQSIFMTITHLAMIGQGIFLLTYFRPTISAALVSLGWFALSDYVDYGLGFYPAIPQQFIPLAVCTAIRLAYNHGQLRHGRLGKRVEQLRAMPDDAAVFLCNAWHETRHILEDDQRDIKRIAKSHKARRLLAGIHVQHPSQYGRLVGDHAHRSTAKMRKAYQHVHRPVLVHL